MVANMALLSGGDAAGGMASVVIWGLVFIGFMYFMIIKPQKKRQQSAKDLLGTLKVGDRIQTIGGFIGEILLMEGDDLIILSEETKLRVKKSAVAFCIDPNSEAEAVAAAESAASQDDDDDDFQIEDFEI